MLSTLTADRVRNDLDVLARAGLGVDDFLVEAADTLRRAVRWEAACMGLHDPATGMLTAGRKFGALAGMDTEDALFSLIEYGGEEPTSFAAIGQSAIPALGMREARRAEEGRSPRMDLLIRPLFGFGDELRLVFRDELGMWGGMALFRGEGTDAFSAEEIAFAAGLSGALARGVRRGALARLGMDAAAGKAASGPAVVIIDANDEVTKISVGAQQCLAQLGSAAHSTDPMGTVFALVVAARGVPSTAGARIPRARVQTPSGAWLVLHASPLAGPEGRSGEVVVTIEEARPPEVVDLVVAAFGLTAREREVTRLVLRGAETKAIATALHLSAYTVQDHLKAIFDKAGVRSRRELVARIYFDQYMPRMNAPVGSSGWFIGSEIEAPAG